LKKPGRPVEGSRKDKKISLRIPSFHESKLKTLGRKYGLSTSEMVRLAIRKLVEDDEN